ncbi:hypothetical protein BaRGS_00018597, partial [Batillaria attramentaria]
ETARSCSCYKLPTILGPVVPDPKSRNPRPADRPVTKTRSGGDKRCPERQGRQAGFDTMAHSPLRGQPQSKGASQK